jgi:hypothetical protein
MTSNAVTKPAIPSAISAVLSPGESVAATISSSLPVTHALNWYGAGGGRWLAGFVN